MDALYICGSTASGKSSAALTLAAALDGEIVNADAFQLYRGLETLTAAPTPEEKAQAPHHLYGVLDQDASADADAYRQLALPVLDDIRSRGKLPIVVGGSGLYIKFLTHGPSDLPPGNEALRKELDALSLDELNKRLAALDPATAATIDRHNPRYVQRALEICILSGQPVSELRQSFDHDPPHLAGLLLQWSPGDLDTRIRQRTAMMLNDGAIDEVAALPAEATSAAKAIGVPEIRALLSGDLTRNDCQERLVISTRQYAKRQRTWFRREKWLTNIDGPFTEEAILSRASHLP
ncbi:MAG: tRNA (adenosine(37)-N6)-dimethylallyltransferase MiaA [Akkermansiaceae bacterium]|nr:tRNA (adenosine(37)-N6)-dimethylallyltransferase MiaA [Akkermansiaceae bacterium]